MRRFATYVAVVSALIGGAAVAATIGKPAPDFALADLQGKPVKLSDYKGKFVVLEWVNPECPFVDKHYSSKNMQTLQKQAANKQVAWLAINSTSPTHSDYKTPAEMDQWMKEQGGAPAATLLDKDGNVGKLYGAKTTPHMYIINPRGELVYAGAIDDKRSTDPADIGSARNYVSAALGEAMAGKPVSVASTSAYGCSVKY